MINFIFLLLTIVFVFLFARAVLGSSRRKRTKFIDNYIFPVAIKNKIKGKYPHLTEDNLYYVGKALRDYFHVCNLAGKRMVSMPSQVVDEAWHEFILYTNKYDSFCKKALGRFLHHVPAEAMPTPTLAKEGIKRAWRLSCFREKIDPTTPHKLPLLFAIDAQLGIANGFFYTRDCKASGGEAYCATHIGCAAGCGSGSGCASGNSGDTGCSSGCGGGCGGGD